jgi:hypothetical protein
MEVRKHHYVPRCYLKGWAGADDSLCEYRKPREKVVARRKHPSETGWIDRLYTLQDVDPDKRDVIEKIFFQRVDQDASNALDFLRSGQGHLPDDYQVGWTRFLLSLLHRHPSQIDHLREMAESAMWDGVEGLAEAYVEQRRPEDPPTIQEYRALHGNRLSTVLFAQVLQEVCSSEKVGNHLLRMNREVVTFTGGERLITSDRPLLWANGLGDQNCVLLLPIGPRRLFMATNGPKANEVLGSWAPGRAVVPILNALVARQAYRYVYGVCENHLPLVQKEMGQGLQSPWRNLIGQAPATAAEGIAA